MDIFFLKKVYDVLLMRAEKLDGVYATVAFGGVAQLNDFRGNGMHGKDTLCFHCLCYGAKNKSALRHGLLLKKVLPALL